MVHHIDNTAAMACVVRGFSKESDLALITGRLWYEVCGMMVEYKTLYVASHANLADGPSRDDLTLLQKAGAQELRAWSFPDFSKGLGIWLDNVVQAEVERAVL